jgi:YD repeat-containing protein
MKKYLLCFFALSLITLFCFSQSAPQDEYRFFEPEPQEIVASAPSVKSVQAKEFQLTPYGRKQDAGNLELFEFDSLGHLVRQVEIENHDTSRVRSLHYSQPGFLAWEKVDDKALAKSYKTGYRLNPDRSVFQTKNYELLNEKSAMLLDTRMYRYNESGKKQTVFSLSNNNLNESHHFKYDDQGRLVEEIFKNREEEVIRTIKYAYNDLGLRTKIEKTDFWRTEHKEIFTYTYNEQARLLQVVWETNGKEKGKMQYEYDEEGTFLQRIRKSVDGNKEVIKEFNYEFFD